VVAGIVALVMGGQMLGLYEIRLPVKREFKPKQGGMALLFTYAFGHCLLMLLAGTFTGFIESFVKQQGLVNFSTRGKQLGGLVVAGAGLYHELDAERNTP